MLNKAERNYCISLWALLAVVRMLGHFRKYPYGKEFCVLTNHSALTWHMSFKNFEG
jgi:hypothetical protein